MLLKKISTYLTLLFLFLLPWQTRYIWQEGILNQGHWEYGTFSIYATEILLWVILIIFFVQNFLKKQVWVDLYQKRKTRYSLLFVLGLLLFSISVGLSDNFWMSYQYVFRLLEALALLAIILWQSQAGIAPRQVDRSTIVADEQAQTLSTVENDWYVFALWAGGIIQGGLGVYQFLNQSVFGSKWLGMAPQQAMQGGASVIEFGIERWLRAYGSFGSPNSLGIYLAVLLVLGFILYFQIQARHYKILVSAGQLFISSGLLLSFSRGAWLAALVGIVALGFLIFSKEKGLLPLFYKQTSFIALISIFWVIIFFPIFSARFNTHLRLEALSISERASQYAEAISFIKTNPLFGVGPGVFTYALHIKNPNFPYWQYQPVHNIYVLLVVEMGIVSVLFLSVVMTGLLRKIIRNNPVYLPVLLVLLVAGIFDHWLASMFTGTVFWWVVWGLGYKKA